MKVERKIIKIDEELCDGCGQCAIACAEGAIKIIDGKAKVVSDNLCDGLGACIGDCPVGALEIIEREADEFNEEAVEEHLAEMKEEDKQTAPACGCPSANLQTFAPMGACQAANKPSSIGTSVTSGTSESTLSHWPIQIRLVPPTAPFLKGADLLIPADCVPAAYPSFQKDFLEGRVMMMGCPKFDDVDGYIDKFSEVFKTADIKSITCVVMEVPCCSGMPMIVKKALELSGKDIPFKEVVISLQGKVLDTALRN